MPARSFRLATDPVALVVSVALIALAAAILASDAPPQRAGKPPGTAATLPSDADLLRNFAMIALEREHEADDDPGVTKWLAPIRIRVSDADQADAATLAALWAHLHRLARLSGLSIRRVEPSETPNFRIVFTARRDFADHVRSSLDRYTPALAVRLSRANCVGMFRQDADTRAIVHATVIIPVDHARARGLLQRCIAEETTQVLGLPNDAALTVASVFNDASHDQALSAHDALLIRLLYHPSIRPGMKRREAVAAAAAALPGVRRAFLALPADQR